ncbi:MAG TPA: hypothetical protein VFW86_02810 [Candidatus Limnocylindrales bacterium]|nr:hypothetical protein [Candidatus Limnocylindrales bacterium]
MPPTRASGDARSARLADDRAVLFGSVRLVAAGEASSIVVSGLRFGERLLSETATFARGLDVSVTLERRADHPAIVVRPLVLPRS